MRTFWRLPQKRWLAPNAVAGKGQIEALIAGGGRDGITENLPVVVPKFNPALSANIDKIAWVKGHDRINFYLDVFRKETYKPVYHAQRSAAAQREVENKFIGAFSVRAIAEENSLRVFRFTLEALQCIWK